MKLNAPKQVTWIIALVLAALSLLGKFVVAALSGAAFWLAFASACLLLVASFFAGL